MQLIQFVRGELCPLAKLPLTWRRTRLAGGVSFASRHISPDSSVTLSQIPGGYSWLNSFFCPYPLGPDKYPPLPPGLLGGLHKRRRISHPLRCEGHVDGFSYLYPFIHSRLYCLVEAPIPDHNPIGNYKVDGFIISIGLEPMVP